MANETKLANIINPQVMQDMVSAGLPKALKFTQDNTYSDEEIDSYLPVELRKNK